MVKNYFKVEEAESWDNRFNLGCRPRKKWSVVASRFEFESDIEKKQEAKEIANELNHLIDRASEHLKLKIESSSKKRAK